MGRSHGLVSADIQREILGRSIESHSSQQIVFYTKDAIAVSFDHNHPEMFRCVGYVWRKAIQIGNALVTHTPCVGLINPLPVRLHALIPGSFRRLLGLRRPATCTEDDKNDRREASKLTYSTVTFDWGGDLKVETWILFDNMS